MANEIGKFFETFKVNLNSALFVLNVTLDSSIIFTSQIRNQAALACLKKDYALM